MMMNLAAKRARQADKSSVNSPLQPKPASKEDASIIASTSASHNNNSDDESTMTTRTIKVDSVTADSQREVDLTLDQLESDFRRQLGERGLIIREMRGDGNCLFRAIGGLMAVK